MSGSKKHFRPNPYIGPQSYERGTTAPYKGRDKETYELTNLLLARRNVLFYAQSGAGKTSLINAGLIPTLEKKHGFEVLPVAWVSGIPPAHVKPKNIFAFNVMDRLDETDIDLSTFAELELTDFLLDLVWRDGKYQYSPTHEVDENDNELEEEAIHPRALIIDQFEELFTMRISAENNKARAAFFKQINQAMEDDPYLYVLFSMRADYVHHLERYTSLLPNDLRSRYYMSRMRPESALKAVQEPAEVAGRPFAPGVADELVKHLRRERMGWNDESWTLGDTVEPVQLQVVCLQLWERMRDLESDVCTLEDLQRVARSYLDIDEETDDPLGEFVSSALGDYYENALETALESAESEGDSAETEITEAYLRDWFSNKAITPALTRGILLRENEATAGVPNTIIDSLESSRLLRKEDRAGSEWMTLVHDSFVEPIRAANEAWLTRTMRQNPWVATAYRWHERGQPEYLLIRGSQLETALTESGDLDKQPQIVRRFLRTSQQIQEQHDKARNRKRIRQLTLSLIAMAVLSLLSFWQFLEARAARNEAVNAEAAEKAARADLQIAILDRDAQTAFNNREDTKAILLALAANNRADDKSIAFGTLFSTIHTVLLENGTEAFNIEGSSAYPSISSPFSASFPVLFDSIMLLMDEQQLLLRYPDASENLLLADGVVDIEQLRENSIIWLDEDGSAFIWRSEQPEAKTPLTQKSTASEVAYQHVVVLEDLNRFVISGCTPNVYGCDDWFLQVWSISPLVPLNVSLPIRDQVDSMERVVNEGQVVTRSASGHRIWEISISKLAEMGCQVAGRNPRWDEWQNAMEIVKLEESDSTVCDSYERFGLHPSFAMHEVENCNLQRARELSRLSSADNQASFESEALQLSLSRALDVFRTGDSIQLESCLQQLVDLNESTTPTLDDAEQLIHNLSTPYDGEKLETATQLAAQWGEVASEIINGRINSSYQQLCGVGTDQFDLSTSACQRWLDSSASGELQMGDSHSVNSAIHTLWQFNGIKGQFVTIDAAQITDGIDLYLQLYDESGQLIGSNDDGGEGYNSRIAMPLGSSGRYVVRVSTLGASGEYEISLEEVQTLEVGQIIVDTTASQSHFRLQSSEAVVVSMQLEGANEEFDPSLTLYDSIGNEVDYSDDNGTGYLGYNAEIVTVLHDNEAYLLAAGQPNSTQPYTLSIRTIEQLVADYVSNIEADSAFSVNDVTQANTLCWYGALSGYAADVLSACDEAIDLSDGEPYIHDSRGVAHVLIGDFEAAIADFEVYVAAEDWYPVDRIERRRQWIEALEDGENPLDQATIDYLLANE